MSEVATKKFTVTQGMSALQLYSDLQTQAMIDCHRPFSNFYESSLNQLHAWFLTRLVVRTINPGSLLHRPSRHHDVGGQPVNYFLLLKMLYQKADATCVASMTGWCRVMAIGDNLCHGRSLTALEGDLH